MPADHTKFWAISVLPVVFIIKYRIYLKQHLFMFRKLIHRFWHLCQRETCFSWHDSDHTCQDIGHLWIQVLYHFHHWVHKHNGVIVSCSIKGDHKLCKTSKVVSNWNSIRIAAMIVMCNASLHVHMLKVCINTVLEVTNYILSQSHSGPVRNCFT